MAVIKDSRSILEMAWGPKYEKMSSTRKYTVGDMSEKMGAKYCHNSGYRPLKGPPQ